MKLSVLMAIHDGCNAEYLIASLDSLEQQSYQADEVVVVIDGYIREELKECLDQYSERLPLEYLVLKNNMGLGVALKYGVERCTGDLIARMDADDISHPQRFKRQYDTFVEDTKLDILGARAIEMIDERQGRVRKVPLYHDEIVKQLWRCPLIHPTVMMKRRRLLEAGNYNPDLRRRQDYELWFRCAKLGLNFKNLPHILLQYRFGIETYKKQTFQLALKQGFIGLNGIRMINAPGWQKLAVFYPALRALLPAELQFRIHLINVRSGENDPGQC